MSTQVQERLREVRERAQAVCASLLNEVHKLGFCEDAVELAGLDQAQFELSRDPASGEDSLVGTWLDGRGQRVGCILFHADGSFFAEHDVVRPHPSDSRWFVEAVTAWGRDDVIKAEPRLLPALA